MFSLSVFAQNKNQEIYSGKEFRNPFVEYIDPVPEPPAADNDKEAEQQVNDTEQNTDNNENQKPAPPKITIEDVKKELPFSLNGIISSNREKVALLNTGGSVEFIRGSYQVEEYKITAIEKDSVIVENRRFKLRLKIGGEIDEI
jgi:type II secretory pathway component PulC